MWTSRAARGARCVRQHATRSQHGVVLTSRLVASSTAAAAADSSESRRSTAHQTTPRAETLPGAVRVHFGNGSTGDFHSFWLRLRDARTRHPTTREQQVRPVDVELLETPFAARVTPDGSALVVEWLKGLPSIFMLEELLQNNYAPARAGVDPVESPLPEIEVSASADWRATLQQHGAVVVRGYGDDTEKLIRDFGTLGLSLWESHFGRIEDLRSDNTTNKNTDQLGYTTVAVDFHTDQPFVESPPPYQALHCIIAAPNGGGANKLADARRIALHLRATDREAFDLLCQTPMHFLREQRAYRSETRKPVFEFNDEGEFVMARSSYFTLAPQMHKFEEMLPYFRAYQAFERLLDDPRFSYRVALAAGDFLAYDNHRMLHARTAFEGARWLRGVYFC